MNVVYYIGGAVNEALRPEAGVAYNIRRIIVIDGVEYAVVQKIGVSSSEYAEEVYPLSWFIQIRNFFVKCEEAPKVGNRLVARAMDPMDDDAVSAAKNHPKILAVEWLGRNACQVWGDDDATYTIKVGR